MPFASINSTKQTMKISWKNIENWRSWKMSFFWGGHFEFLSRPFWIFFFLLHFIEKCSPFLWGIIFFCTMDVFSRILEKKLYELLCTRLYVDERKKLFRVLSSTQWYYHIFWVRNQDRRCRMVKTQNFGSEKTPNKTPQKSKLGYFKFDGYYLIPRIIFFPLIHISTPLWCIYLNSYVRCLEYTHQRIFYVYGTRHHPEALRQKHKSFL